MALLRLVFVTCHFIGFLASPLAQEYEDYEYDYEYDYDPTIDDSAKVDLENLDKLLEEFGDLVGGFEVDFLTGEDANVCQLPPELMDNGNGE